MLTTKKKIIIGLLIVMVILFILTLYLLYTNFYNIHHKQNVIDNFYNTNIINFDNTNYIKCRYVKILNDSTPFFNENHESIINLAGVFIYDDKGNNVAVTKNYMNASMSSQYTYYNSSNRTTYYSSASHAIFMQYIKDRTLSQALTTSYQDYIDSISSKNKEFQNWDKSGFTTISQTRGSTNANPDWWMFDLKNE
jgi:hypothetical protein